MQRPKASAVPAVALGDIAEVLPGFSAGGALVHDPNGTHQVILSRHLTAGAPYVYGSADEMRITPARPTDRYNLLAGDVLIMSRGMRNVASWIEKVPDPSITTVSFYVLRPRGQLDPAYLTWYLNSPTAQRQIADARTGAGTPLVQRDVFALLPIPLPAFATQQEIGALGLLMVREQQLRQQLADKVVQLHALNSEQLVRSLLRTSAPEHLKLQIQPRS
ncbi:MAG: restriction endonuclease subunit S [Gemmatimonadaceae bacterium]